MISLQRLIEADVNTLLSRALLNKTLVAFGEDGLGKCGRCDTPQFYNVIGLNVAVELDEANDTATGEVYIDLERYDANCFGAIYTDHNFLLSVQQALDAIGVDQTVLSYALACRQGRHCVAMNIDVKRLLEWP